MTQMNASGIKALAIVSANLNVIHDPDIMLEQALSKAREIICAEAGSIYLLDGDGLVFKFVQNNKLPVDSKNKRMLLYQHKKLPVTASSISGFVALYGQTVVVDDVYNIPSEKDYSFDKTFDEDSGYKTVNVLAVPLKNSRDEVFGVIQLLNHTDDNGSISSFSSGERESLELFATFMASAYERILISNEMVMRMVNMARLRDPLETGNHVMRVASYSVEIFRAWAREHDSRSEKEIDAVVDILRVAAMLHDIGKVAISDSILKKPGRLTAEEFDVIKTHPTAGKELFTYRLSSLDEMSAMIAHTHHERWDGKGYPQGLSDRDIPIEGRIVALADVYDALSSKRAYKEAWKEADVLAEIRKSSGTQFDAEVVESFFSVYEVISLIKERYND
ncbi:HD domain-containing protein [bacterium]|nr:HD domain-containing protein [bacterium]